MIVKVPLERIRPSPFQREIDRHSVLSLAADILERGLLEPPGGRLVDEDGRPLPVPDSPDAARAALERGALVELIFGHHRVEAFRILARSDPRFSEIPVDIVSMSDEAAALAAWAENERRRSSDPIEQARLIRQMMARFGWSIGEASRRLRLPRATLQERLRLLELPDGLREAVRAGRIAPSAAVEAGLLARAAGLLEEAGHAVLARGLKRIVEEAKEGRWNREELRGTLRTHLRPLPAYMVSREAPGDFRSSRCSACRFALQRGSEFFCMDPSCRERKQDAIQRAVVEEVAAAIGARAMADAEVPDDAVMILRPEDLPGDGDLILTWDDFFAFSEGVTRAVLERAGLPGLQTEGINFGVYVQGKKAPRPSASSVQACEWHWELYAVRLGLLQGAAQAIARRLVQEMPEWLNRLAAAAGFANFVSRMVSNALEKALTLPKADETNIGRWPEEAARALREAIGEFLGEVRPPLAVRAEELVEEAFRELLETTPAARRLAEAGLLLLPPPAAGGVPERIRDGA